MRTADTGTGAGFVDAWAAQSKRILVYQVDVKVRYAASCTNVYYLYR